MDFQPVTQTELTTLETRKLRSQYPSIEHLEAGHAASWLQERHDQLLCKAKASRSEMNFSKLIGLGGLAIGAICYATSPLATIGAIASATSYFWSVALDLNDSHRFAPIPFVRDNIMEFLTAMGDAEAREDWLSQRNEIADLMFHLELLERYEFAMLRGRHSILSEYLSGVESGKRFYAYRWLCDRYVDYKGAIPDQESLTKHLETVTCDPRVNYDSVKAISSRKVFQLPSKDVTPSNTTLPSHIQDTVISCSSTDARAQRDAEAIASTPYSERSAVSNITDEVSPISNRSVIPEVETVNRLPIVPRAEFIVRCLVNSGFKIDEVMSSQVIAIAGSQRGGKGTLAAILATLSKAYDPTLVVEYFTAGVDIYPFACNLHSGLQYPNKDSEQADRQVATNLLKFLKKLESSTPYSHKNLLLVIDEAMRLLSLMNESDRTWALQFLLSRFAKTGATLIIVLHANHLSAIAGKETAGLAATFKEGVQFVGCSTVAVDAGGLRKMNVASGAYFKANVKNFGSAIAGGELGSIPEWLKTELHPGNGHPDPARTLLKFFPELSSQSIDALTQQQRTELNEASQNVKFTIFNASKNDALKLIEDLQVRGYEQNQIITMLWNAQPDTNEWVKAIDEYELLMIRQEIL
ncbi:MAG: ATP-binding protein [Nostoc sp. NMS7]|uniref:hypothetical protein n=1 Tax=Nostoc sp. NMS7 TaxID=2815391 RepID=UPI0025F76333|nr:hypothetical protein [Nostoc sp. NMS7]MBN3948436.1 ATP-binding protein [Nostoc sp. NMS7]